VTSIDPTALRKLAASIAPDEASARTLADALARAAEAPTPVS